MLLNKYLYIKSVIMGCAYVTNRQIISSKDVNLITNDTRIKFKESNDITNITSKLTGDISPVKDKNFKEKKHKLFNKNSLFADNKNNSHTNKKPEFSGPIITMLKRQVDNYKEKQNKDKKRPL